VKVLVQRRHASRHFTPYADTIAANGVMNRIRGGVGASAVSDAANGAARKPAIDKRDSSVVSSDTI
jgi:hypothetical protein